MDITIGGVERITTDDSGLRGITAKVAKKRQTQRTQSRGGCLRSDVDLNHGGTEDTEEHGVSQPPRAIVGQRQSAVSSLRQFPVEHADKDAEYADENRKPARGPLCP